MKNTNNFNDFVISKLLEINCYGKILSINHLNEIKEEISILRTRNLIDKDLYQEYLSNFNYDPIQNFPQTKSIIIVAYPQMPTRIYFTLIDKIIPAVIPPTYLAQFDEELHSILSSILQENNFNITRANLPKKITAVRSGLCEYGRNNICYIKGLGSYIRLVAFFSDMPAQSEEWHSPQMMVNCQNCSACINNCPTKAIEHDRFLLHAERCISYWNEKPNDIPFPDWFEFEWHNSLSGCMLCQKICPENKQFLQSFNEGVTFSREETELLLRDDPSYDHSSINKKLEQMGMANYLEIMPRNLKALFNSNNL